MKVSSQKLYLRRYGDNYIDGRLILTRDITSSTSEGKKERLEIETIFNCKVLDLTSLYEEYLKEQKKN